MNQRPVTRQEGQAVAQKIGATSYVECSAKNGTGVREVFQTATKAALSAKGGKSKGSRSGSKKPCVVL